MATATDKKIVLASSYTPTFYYVRKIKCQKHYILKPGGTPFVMERDPRWAGKISDKTAKEFGFSIWRRKKNRNGQWIQNFKDYWQPEINPNLAREKWFDPNDYICRGCKRCILK